ncbi:MAG: hypothetical protein MI867_13820 [Pseudomonadales bacterium]|nr:hypothetical protein [Pseudomonadales bacterium]
MLYKPLYLSLLYLVVGFVYFLFGPVEYHINNQSELVLYFLLYMIAGMVGYVLGVYFILRLKANKSEKVFVVNFGVVALVAFSASAVFNLVATKESLIPINVFEFLRNLIAFDTLALANAYYEKKAAAEGHGGNLFASGLLLVFGWARFIFLPYIIWNWASLSRGKRLASILIVVFPVLTGLSVGTNKPIFDVALVFFLSTLSIYYIRRIANEEEESRRLKGLLRKTGYFLCVAILLFGVSMNFRGVTFDYIEANSVSGNITVDNDLEENVFSVGVLMLGHYMVQGYYGMSLSLSEKHESSFGFGHSPFLLRQLERVSGERFSERTFQAKINHEWAMGVRWHSAFSQFANDVGFPGVVLVVFVIFFMFALSWVMACVYRCREFIYTLPLHGIIVIFLPANNQVFGFLDSLFLVLLITLLLLYRALRNGGRKIC